MISIILMFGITFGMVAADAFLKALDTRRDIRRKEYEHVLLTPVDELAEEILRK